MILWILLLFPLFLCSTVPVITPNGSTLPWTLDGDVKVFRLKAEPVKQKFGKELIINAWGYNGQTPGPTIEAFEGDHVRFIVENALPEGTSIHWHGILLPNSMDGVAGLTQAPIPPGGTFTYEFQLKQTGTYLYHAHTDDMIQQGMGLIGFFIIHPKEAAKNDPERDFAIMLQEWFIPIGANTPDPTKMDFNYFTFNGSVWPAEPLVVKKGEKVRIRLGNLSMNSHPIHLHGYLFNVAAKGGLPIPQEVRYTTSTVNVPPGETREIEFVANVEGDWILHCHKSHHTMNGMSHILPNVIGTDQTKSSETIQSLQKNYMPMGSQGMGEMFHHGIHAGAVPNYLPHGSPGPFGPIEMSGMFTIVKVREGIDSYVDPGWFLSPASK